MFDHDPASLVLSRGYPFGKPTLLLYHHTTPIMATNGVGDQEAFAPAAVLDAVLTMRSNDADRKKKAATYLESFQKSVGFQLLASRGRIWLLMRLTTAKRMDYDHYDPEVGRRA